MTFAPATAAQALKAGRNDPLAGFTYMNPVQRTLVKNLSKAEIYLHAANIAGKTTIGSAVSVALAQGRTHLAGEPLPRIEMPAAGALLVGSYKQSTESSVAAYRRWIGDWPHFEAMVQTAMDYVGIFYIKPIGWKDDDHKTWSRIYVFTHDGEVPEGLRLDWVHPDEIPPAPMLRALRWRRRGGGKPFLLYITGTPIDVTEWGYLMEENEYKNCLNQITKGKLRLQTSIYDNSYLTAADIEAAEIAAASDPHGRARLMGEHVDIRGTCPFDAMCLERLRRRCKPGEASMIPVYTKQTGGDGERFEIPLSTRIFGPRDERDSYYATFDLASGIRAPGHDPLGMNVWARGARRLVQTYNGFVHPYGLGWMGAEVGRAWTTPVGPCLIDPEANGGYFDQFMEGLKANGYYNLSFDPDKTTTKKLAVGYSQSKQTRDNIIAAWQRALMNDDIVMESEEELNQLANCQVYDDGFIAARPGFHDELVICGGRSIHIIDARLAPRPRPKQQITDVDRLNEILSGIFKRPIGESAGRGHRWRLTG